MKAKIALLKRIKKGDRYVFKDVEIRLNKPVPDENAAAYYLRYSENGRQRTKSMGLDLQAAYVEFLNRDLNLERIRRGLPPDLGPAGLVRDFRKHASSAGRTRIEDAVKKYIQELTVDVDVKRKRSKGTLRGYSNAVLRLEEFTRTQGLEYLDEITGDVLRKHETWMYANVRKRVRGKKENTIAKHFRFLNTFFNKQGIRMTRDRNAQPGDLGLLDHGDVLREEKKATIDKYTAEDINNMLSVADVDQTDLIQFFLRTGARDEEVAYLEWKDIDWKNQRITICEKPGVWKPKDKENRTLPVRDGVLLKRLEARRKRQRPPSHLVFPNTLGGPDMHLIRQLHKIVARLKAKDIIIEGAPTLHRFRRTYATMMAKGSDVPTVQKLLGHSDMATTARYLAADDVLAEKASETAFAEIGS